VPPPSELGRTLVLSCAALAGDIRAVTATPGWDHIDFEYLPANYHNRPEKIVKENSAPISSPTTSFAIRTR